MTNDELRITNLPAGRQGYERRTTASTCFIVCLILLALPLISYAKTLIVGSDYATIGAALEQAMDGDVIEVMQGEYKEQFNVNKSVHLKGIDNPVIIASQAI